jgi:hypothetical protein
MGHLLILLQRLFSHDHASYPLPSIIFPGSNRLGKRVGIKIPESGNDRLAEVGAGGHDAGFFFEAGLPRDSAFFADWVKAR